MLAAPASARVQGAPRAHTLPSWNWGSSADPGHPSEFYAGLLCAVEVWVVVTRERLARGRVGRSRGHPGEGDALTDKPDTGNDPATERHKGENIYQKGETTAAALVKGRVESLHGSGLGAGRGLSP